MGWKMGRKKGERNDRISFDKITIYVLIVRRLIINPLWLLSRKLRPTFGDLFGKSSPSVRKLLLFPLLASFFHPLWKIKKERGREKEEGERTKEQTLNNFILDRSQLSTNYDDASVPWTNEQLCKGNKGRTKRKKERKKEKKKRKETPHISINQKYY